MTAHGVHSSSIWITHAAAVSVMTRRPVSSVAVSAHRGASAELPENTLAAFRAALDHGADGFELDVALSADGVAVVLHDDTVDRTTDGVGPVTALTAADLRALDAGRGEHVPTLDEVLALAAGRAEVNVEIKDPEAAAAVATVVKGHPDLTFFVSSFRWGALAEMRALDGSVRLYPLVASVSELDAALAFAVEVGAAGLSVWENGLTAAHVDRIHAAGLQVFVWTVNDPVRAAELIAVGADALCTDDPAALLALRTRLAG